MAFIAATQSLNVFSDKLIPLPENSLILTATATSLVAMRPEGGGTAIDGDFTFPPEGGRVEPTGGTIEDYSVGLPDGTRLFDLTGGDVDVETFLGFRAEGDVFGYVQYLLQGADTLFGSAGADTLAGFDGDDTLNGNPGNDLVYGNGGADRVIGGSGNDWLFGGMGADTVLGGPGDDPFVTGNLGDDYVFGNLGNDTIYGGQGDDTLIGDDGDGSGNGGEDLLFGDRGDDDLYGDFGDDTLVGGTGADRFFFFTGEGVDRIIDFQPGEGDRIAIEMDINGTGIETFAELQPNIRADGFGGSYIDLGDDNGVFVERVPPGALAQDMVQFFF